MNSRKCLKGETTVSLVSALGSIYFDGCLPKRMKQGIKDVYFKSGQVQYSYLYFGGREIKDGKNYNLRRTRAQQSVGKQGKNR